MESTTEHRKKKLFWKLCFLVSQGRKDTSRQIQEKRVWLILGIVLHTQQHSSSYFCQQF
jgi:hypothetical protein